MEAEKSADETFVIRAVLMRHHDSCHNEPGTVDIGQQRVLHWFTVHLGRHPVAGASHMVQNTRLV